MSKPRLVKRTLEDLGVCFVDELDSYKKENISVYELPDLEKKLLKKQRQSTKPIIQPTYRYYGYRDRKQKYPYYLYNKKDIKRVIPYLKEQYHGKTKNFLSSLIKEQKRIHNELYNIYTGNDIIEVLKGKSSSFKWDIIKDLEDKFSKTCDDNTDTKDHIKEIKHQWFIEANKELSDLKPKHIKEYIYYKNSNHIGITIDWKNLELDNPVLYVAMRTKFNE